jgi:hypothetical protein
MDPMTPINPGQGRLPEIHLAPAAARRITPDQQRNNSDDQQQAEADADEVFEELLEEAEVEGDESSGKERRARDGNDEDPGPHIDISA